MKEENHREDLIDENKSPETEIEKKLGELMLRGWSMTADSCPIESTYNYLTKDATVR